MRAVRLATLTWITVWVWLLLGTAKLPVAKAQLGAYRAYLPLIRTPSGFLNGYLVLLTSDYDGDQEVYTVRGDGSDSTQLTFDESSSNEPQFSPDGEQILYRQTLSATEDDYYLIEANGAGMRPLAELPGRDDLARWSPDGSAIAFRNRNPTTLTSDLYWINPDGSPPQLVHTNVQTFAWAPNGSRLAYTISRLVGSVTYFDLYVFTPSTAQSLLLISDTTKNFGWSPDSAAIAFSARRSNNNELFTVTPDGTPPLQLTTNAVDDDFVGWVDGGARIAFTRALAVLETPRNIYLLRPDGTQEIRLTNTSDFKQVVSIAPNGRYLVFTRVAESEESQRLYLQATNSASSAPISQDICTQTGTLICGWGNITWAADGNQLAYHQFIRPRQGQTGQGTNEIYLTSVNNPTPTTTLLLEVGTSPIWLPGIPYILVYAPPEGSVIPIPHSVDTRSAQRFPLTGVGEDAFYYDWEYVGTP